TVSESAISSAPCGARPSVTGWGTSEDSVVIMAGEALVERPIIPEPLRTGSTFATPSTWESRPATPAGRVSSPFGGVTTAEEDEYWPATASRMEALTVPVRTRVAATKATPSTTARPGARNWRDWWRSEAAVSEAMLTHPGPSWPRGPSPP